jgi:hypothetical protein
MEEPSLLSGFVILFFSSFITFIGIAKIVSANKELEEWKNSTTIDKAASSPRESRWIGEQYAKETLIGYLIAIVAGLYTFMVLCNLIGRF